MKWVLVVAALLLPSTAHAQSVRGFAEVRAAFSPGAEGTVWQLVERVRPTFEADLGDRVRFVTTVEAALSQGRNMQEEFQRILDESDFKPLLDAANCTWPTYANEYLRIDSIEDVLKVDRLYLDVYLPFLDLRVGRQALNWGSGQGFNPTDPFPEVLFAEPWRPRAGVNSVRLNIPLPADNDLTMVVATSDLFDAFRLAGRFRTRVAGTDIAMVGAWRGQGSSADGTGLVGLDVRGTNVVGWWFEGALHIDGQTVQEEFVAGLDYSFPVLDGMVLMAQYLRNGRGGGAAGLGSIGSAIHGPECDLSGVPAAGGGEAPSLFPEAAEADPFAPTFSGRNYLFLTISQRFIEEISASVVALQNLDDGTGFLIVNLNTSPLGWLEVAVSAQVPYALADGGEFKPREQDLTLTQDLGPLLGEFEADFSGLLADATVTVWTRVSF